MTHYILKWGSCVLTMAWLLPAHLQAGWLICEKVFPCKWTSSCCPTGWGWENQKSAKEQDINQIAQAVVHTMSEKDKSPMLLTTEAFSRPMWGIAPGVHLFFTSLHTSRKVTMFAGLVAHFTSAKPLAQAEDEASHKMAKAAVTNRSWEKKDYQFKTNKPTTMVASLKQLSWTWTT